MSNSNDDAEERNRNGKVRLTSSDLELVKDRWRVQTVGIRFTGVNVPAGASITNAYVEFETDETDIKNASLILRGESSSNAAPFTTTAFDISNRTLVSSTVAWNNVSEWNTVNEKHQTPDISSIVQDIVDGGGWMPGNAMVFTVSGTGERTAESYDGEPLAAPLLHVEYIIGNQAPVLDLIPDITVNEGETVFFNPTAADPDENVLTFSYSGWMTSNSYTTNYTDAGTHTVMVIVSDGVLTDSQVVTITVTDTDITPPNSSVSINNGAESTNAASVTLSFSSADNVGVTGYYLSTILSTPLASNPDWISVTPVNNFNADVPYTLSSGDGVKTVYVWYKDAAGNVSVAYSDSINLITVSDVAPVLDPIANITVNEGDTVTLNPTATDAGGDALTFTYSGWMTSDTYTTSYLDAGIHTVTVTVTDGTLTDSLDVMVSVTDVNVAPVLNTIDDITVNEGETVTFNPTATDLDGDTLTLSYSGWMTSSSYTTNYTEAGTHTVTVTASDGLLVDTQDVTITVVDVNTNSAPVLTPLADIIVNEGETVTLIPTATDPDGDTLTFSYSGWMTSNSYTTNYTDAGTHTVMVIVSDGVLTDSQIVTITVTDTDITPPNSSVSINNGAESTNSTSVTLSFSSADNVGVTGYYLSAILSTPLASNPDWINVTPVINFNADVPHTISSGDGVKTVYVWYKDAAGNVSDAYSDSINLITVSDVAPVLDPIANITVNEGDTVTLNPRATDASGDALTFTYSGWMTSDTYTTSYLDAGIHTVTVTVTDGTLTDTQDVMVSVTNVNVAPVLNTIANITVNEGETVTLNPTASDPDGDTLKFSYSGWMYSDTYTTTYLDAGIRTVTITVTDGTLTDSLDVTITVNNINQAPVLATISPIIVNEGVAIILNPTATDTDGDALTFSYSGWMTSSSYTTNYNDVGTHTVTVTVSDGTLTDSQVVTITVNNINQTPVLATISPIAVNEGVAINLNPTATDPDGDMLTFSYSGWMSSSSYTTNYTDAGTYTVTVTVSDGILMDTQNVSITVLNTNQAPVLGPITDITVNEGEAIALSPNATDADGDTLTFSYSGWMTSNSYIANYTDSGVHTVSIMVSDGVLTVSHDVTVTVIDVNQSQNLLLDPGFEAGGSNWERSSSGVRSIVTSEAYSGLASQQMLVTSQWPGTVLQDVPITEGLIYDTSGWVKVNGIGGTGSSIKILWQDSSGNTLQTNIIDTFTGTQDWNQMSGSYLAPTGAVIANLNLLTDPEPDGTGAAWFDDLSFTLNQQQNLPPVLDPISSITVNVGDTVSFNPTATDSDGNTLTFTYSGWMTSGSYATSSIDVGTHTVTVTVSDGILTDSQDVTITVVGVDAPVLDPIANITVNEGDTITFNPTATDPNGYILTYTYTGWMTSSTYSTSSSDVGTHTVTVTVNNGILTDSQDVTITVINTDVSQVTASWNANTESDLAGYKVYYGTSSGNYDANADVGNKTSYTLSNLASGVTYYIAVTAYDSFGNESAYSGELIYNTPAF